MTETFKHQERPVRLFHPPKPVAGRLLAFLLLLPALCWGTLVPRMNFEEMADASEFVIHGTVSRNWSDWDAARQFIWTHYEIQITDTLKGPAFNQIVISEPGGVVGEMGMSIAGSPAYGVGEEVVLFVARTATGLLRTCGWGQGRFRVVRAEGASLKVVRPGMAGVELVDPVLKAGSAARKPPRKAGTAIDSFNGLTLEEFKRRVRRLIQARGE